MQADNIETGNFNPHSREGSDNVGDIIPIYLEISIHTPAKGVTFNPISMETDFEISIHTPAKGVTWKDLERLV